jgi:hypothetical protein
MSISTKMLQEPMGQWRGTQRYIPTQHNDEDGLIRATPHGPHRPNSRRSLTRC